MAEQLTNQSNPTNQVLFDTESSPVAVYPLDGITFIVYTINCAFNVILAFIAMFGNLTVLLAIRKTTTLHPPSKALLSGLALSDLAVGAITQPVFVEYAAISLSKQSLQVGTNSTIAISILGIMLVAVSLLTVTAISIDRVLALHLKTRYRQVVTLTRVVIVLIAIWLFGGVTTTACYFNRAQSQIILLALLVFCITVTSINYLNIYRVMHQHHTRVFILVEHPSSSGGGDSNSAAVQVRFRRSVNSALYIYLALIFCAIPYLCVGGVSFFVGWNTAMVVSRHIGETIMYLNSSLNPLLYCWTSRDLKRAMLATLRRPCSDE